MLDVENCGNWVQKRNLKLENFLRKSLVDFGSSFPRYYETCVIDWKGSLLLRNVVVTDGCILFTENPPKSIVLSIPFSDIIQINLVADRKTLIKGGNNNSYICQHVSVLYNAQKKTSKEPQDEMPKSHQQSQHDITSDFGSSKTKKTGSRTSSRITRSDRSLMTYDTVLTSDATTTDNSRQSSSLDSAYVPLSIYHAYEPLVYISPFPRAPTLEGAVDEISTSSSSLSKHPKNNTKASKKRTHDDEMSSSMNSDGRSSDESRSGSSGCGYSDLGRRDDDYNEDILERLVPTIRRGNSNLSSPLKPGGGNSSSGRKNGSQTPTENMRRARSVDISQLSLLRKMFGRFGSEKEIKEKNSWEARIRMGGSTMQLNEHAIDSNDSGIGSESDAFNAEFPKEDLQILNFYLYKPNSMLLNELFLFWNRHSLNCTLQMDQMDGLQPEREISHSLRAAEKVFAKLSRVWNPLDVSLWETSTAIDFNSILPKLASLHRSLMKYEHLKRICWKNWDMILNLVGVMRSLWRGFGFDSPVKYEDEEQFIDRMSAISVIMDILRLIYQACGTSWFQGKTVSSKNNNNYYNTIYDNGSHSKEGIDVLQSKLPRNLHEVTDTIVRVILESELVPHAESFDGTDESQRNIITNVTQSPQKFAEGRWVYLAQAKAIKTVTMAHNASAALLHEILCIVHFSSKDNGRAKLLSYLAKCPMEVFVKLSLTQVVNLLWSNSRILNPSQAALLFRHVSILQTLLEASSKLKKFLRDEFYEEFRYFVHEESAARKISDRYPLKSKLLTMFEELRQEIISK